MTAFYGSQKGAIIELDSFNPCVSVIVLRDDPDSITRRLQSTNHKRVLRLFRVAAFEETARPSPESRS